LGVVKSFETKNSTLTTQQLEQLINERFNLELFNLNFDDNNFKGTLKPNLFQNNVADFFTRLKSILPQNQGVDAYFQDFGDDINEYPQEFSRINIYDAQGNKITLQLELVLLFLEGKVSAEVFNIEPQLISWLFRHSSFDNPLAGAIISDIVG
ncbi:MAG: hypothetical protein WA896_12040, partial [Spirulinaceae cyanobacterium]